MMPKTREVTNEDGRHVVTTFPSGAESWALIEPSREYRDRREAERQAEEDRARNDAQARVDLYAAWQADMDARLAAVESREVRAALAPIYKNLEARKRENLAIDAAERVLT